MQPVNIINGSWKQGVEPKVVNLTGTAFMEEAGAHVFHISAEDASGAAIAFTGTVSALFLRADNTTVAIDGEISEGAAEVTLVSDCYHAPGRFSIAIYVSNGTESACVYAAVGNVYRTSSDVVIDSGATIPTLAQLQGAYANCVTAAGNATSAAAAAVGNFAVAFAEGTANAPGTYVTYSDGKMYYLPEGHTANATWANTTKTEVKVGGELTDLKGAVTGMTTATASDEGKALKAKTVSGGKVTEWEFGDTGSQVVVDPTLTQAGEAADAKAAGDAIHSLNSFDETSTDVDVLDQLINGQYINTSGSVGDTISPTPVSHSSHKSKIFTVVDGDKFLVTGNENSDTRAVWCFTDGDYKILSKSSNNAVTNAEITASSDGYLVINMQTGYSSSKLIRTVYSGKTLQEKIGEIDDDIESLDDDVDAVKTDIENMTAATSADVGKFLRAKSVANGKVTEWELGEDQRVSHLDDNVVKIPNMFNDPTFKDITDTNNFVFASQASETVQNGILTCTSQKTTNQSIMLKIADSLDTDILYYNYKVSVTGLNGYNLNCSFAGATTSISTEGTAQTISGYRRGGESKALVLSISGTAERVINIYCPIAINVTALFGAGHEPTFTEFSTMIANWDRDNVGEWISLQKYEFLQKRAVVLAQNIAVRNVLNDYGTLVTLFTETPTDATGDGNNAYVLTSTISYQNQYSVGDVIYTSITAKVSDSDCLKIALYHNNAPNENYKMMEVENPESGTWYRLSGIFVPESTTGTERFAACAAHYADAETQTGKTLSYKLGIGLNLTAIFGKGHEPMDASVIDAMLTRYPNQWFAGIQDIWHPTYTIGMAGRIRQFANGAYYGEDGEGRFIASSIIDASNEDWTHAQYTYGLDKFLVKVPHQFDGGIETNGMYTVMLPKYARWERGAAGADTGSLFGGHIFEAWNNIGTYRLTMMMAHGGDKVSYTDPEDDVTTETAREDEACIIVYSPGGSYSNPLKTPTELQSHLRIRRSRDDYYFGTNPQNLLGRVRIGSDTATEGVVFTRTKMISYNQMILADKTQENKGKLLKFNNDGTVTWEEVDLYGNWVPEENNT